jgi:hypothetical protein
MSSILALSVSDKIDQYGAYAGLASVLGLAVLSLLYFAQAREVKRLREWAGRAPERAAELQAQATAAAQQRVIAQPSPQPQRPVAPAVPTPALAAGARPAAATPAGQAQGVPVAPAAAAAATAAGAATAAPGAPPAPGAPAAPNGPAGQPTTVQPAANGAATASPVARPGQPLRVPGSTGTPPPRAPFPEPDDEGRSRGPIIAAVAALAVVAIVAVVLLTGAFGGDSPTTQKANTIGTPGEDASAASSKTATTGAKGNRPSATPKPGSYVVAVLNGTTVPGLARGVGNRLENTKYKIGTVTDAADQGRSQTIIEFVPGHRAEADSVAKAINVGSDAIQPMSAGSRTIAGEEATVVVTVGADQNTSPQTATTTP